MLSFTLLLLLQVLGNDPNDYLIDHSVMFYLIDPKGEREKRGQRVCVCAVC